ncbi:hypothetical protein COLO4_38383 [Corchorus olitorius]|uniref:Uncharacterized protein n=1 Tax=Corchorus olitorius TaxID=93759 RepID=A0A1R3FVB9_9ROSI|nr:hypothetical protein COLO4_38383 [Corchorus olitorius]
MRIAPRKHFVSSSSCRFRLQAIETMKEERFNYFGGDEVPTPAIVRFDRLVGGGGGRVEIDNCRCFKEGSTCEGISGLAYFKEG